MFAVTLDNTHQDHHSQRLLVLSRHFLRLYLIHNIFQDTYIYMRLCSPHFLVNIPRLPFFLLGVL